MAIFTLEPIKWMDNMSVDNMSTDQKNQFLYNWLARYKKSMYKKLYDAGYTTSEITEAEYKLSLPLEIDQKHYDMFLDNSVKAEVNIHVKLQEDIKKYTNIAHKPLIQGFKNTIGRLFPDRGKKMLAAKKPETIENKELTNAYNALLKRYNYVSEKPKKYGMLQQSKIERCIEKITDSPYYKNRYTDMYNGLISKLEYRPEMDDKVIDRISNLKELFNVMDNLETLMYPSVKFDVNNKHHVQLLEKQKTPPKQQPIQEVIEDEVDLSLF